jgi:catechol 2,3-dioxygenase
MQIQELGHIVLYVRDLKRSLHFYRDVLGFRQVLAEEDMEVGWNWAAFSSPSNRTHHEMLLIEVGPDAASLPAGRRVGMYHFGLKVGDSDDELREARQTMQKHGVDILGMTDHGVVHSIYIRDPDGHEIEIYADMPGMDWRADPSLLAHEMRPLVL